MLLFFLVKKISSTKLSYKLMTSKGILLTFGLFNFYFLFIKDYPFGDFA